MHHFHCIDICYFKSLSIPLRHHVSGTVPWLSHLCSLQVFVYCSSIASNSDPHESVGKCKNLQTFSGAPFGISVRVPSVVLCWNSYFYLTSLDLGLEKTQLPGASFLNRARNSRCTVITDLDTSKRSTQKTASCCDAILETGPAAPQ